MRAIGISNGYMSERVYIIWDIPHDKINYYEVWRDKQIIAQSQIDDSGKPIAPPIHTDLEKANPFIHPCMFDHDHHTNLFWKDSTHMLMYVDDTVHKFQQYKYHVVARRIDDNGQMQDMVVSNDIYIEAL